MASTIILSDNGASSGSAGLKQTAGNDGVLILQTTTSGGTATNAVYVNASQNVGFRTTPAAWGSVAKAIQIGARGSLFEYNGTTTDVMNNGYFDGTNYVYLETATAAFHRMATGRHQLYSAASGTAGATITWTNVLQVEKDYTLALQGGTSSAGTGIAFPATQSASTDANTLDDYEEGTWSPSITGSGGGTCSLYSGSSGTYTKVGRFVTMNFQLQISSISGVSGGVQISGLPFTSASGTTNQFFNCPIYFLTMASNPNNTIVCQSASASTTYNVYEYNNTTIVHDVLPISRMQAGTYVRGTLFMFV